MASIQRRRDSKIWTAYYRDSAKRLHSRSTGTTDKKLAKRAAEEYEAAACGKERTLRQFMRVMDAMHELATGERVVRVTLRQHVATWLETKRPETASATDAFYTVSTGKLLAYLSPKADEPITTITKTDLLGYRAHLAKSLRPGSVNHHIGAMRMLFSSAIRDGVLSDDPAEFVDAVKPEHGAAAVRRGFRLEELRAILSQADDEWRSLILCGLYSGQRLSDLVCLTWANVDLQKGQLRLTTRKTGKVLILPLAPALQKHFESLPSSDEPTAPIHPRALATLQSQEGRVSSLSAEFHELLVQSGLAPVRSKKSKGIGRCGRREQSELSFHSLRHCATTLMHEAGVPESVARTFIGHDSKEIHRKYVGVGMDALIKAAAALPEL
jgi:integrase